MHSPLSFIVSCLTHTSGAKDAFGMRCSISIGKARVKFFVISSVIALSNISLCLLQIYGCPDRDGSVFLG